MRAIYISRSEFTSNPAGFRQKSIGPENRKTIGNVKTENQQNNNRTIISFVFLDNMQRLLFSTCYSRTGYMKCTAIFLFRQVPCTIHIACHYLMLF